jgi:hypothetical protein
MYRELISDRSFLAGSSPNHIPKQAYSLGLLAEPDFIQKVRKFIVEMS